MSDGIRGKVLATVGFYCEPSGEEWSVDSAVLTAMLAELARLRATLGVINDMVRATDPDAAEPLEHAVARELLGLHARVGELNTALAKTDAQLAAADALREAADALREAAEHQPGASKELDTAIDAYWRARRGGA